MKKKVKYDSRYFINLFNKVDKLGVKSLESKCALYYLGCKKEYSATPKVEAAANLLRDFGSFPGNYEPIYSINDNSTSEFDYLGDTPKERILVALEIVKGSGLG